MTKTITIKDWNRPQWRPHTLQAGDRVKVEQALVFLEQRLAPCSDVKILDLVSRVFLQWNDKKTEADKDLLLNDWADDLAGYSEAHIREVCSHWRRNEVYRPTIAAFINLLRPKKSFDEEHRRRARVLLGLEKPRPWEYAQRDDDGPPISPERKAELRRKVLQSGGPLASAINSMMEKGD